MGVSYETEFKLVKLINRSCSSCVSTATFLAAFIYRNDFTLILLICALCNAAHGKVLKIILGKQRPKSSTKRNDTYGMPSSHGEWRWYISLMCITNQSPLVCFSCTRTYSHLYSSHRRTHVHIHILILTHAHTPTYNIHLRSHTRTHTANSLFYFVSFLSYATCGRHGVAWGVFVFCITFIYTMAVCYCRVEVDHDHTWPQVVIWSHIHLISFKNTLTHVRTHIDH